MHCAAFWRSPDSRTQSDCSSVISEMSATSPPTPNCAMSRLTAGTASRSSACCDFIVPTPPQTIVVTRYALGRDGPFICRVRIRRALPQSLTDRPTRTLLARIPPAHRAGEEQVGLEGSPRAFFLVVVSTSRDSPERTPHSPLVAIRSITTFREREAGEGSTSPQTCERCRTLRCVVDRGDRKS